MKQFNKSIQIKVELDTIANKLLSTFVEDNPHREMITETIIEAMYSSNQIHFLYNNLNGWTNDLNFTVGQQVMCTDIVYNYIEKDRTAGQHTEIEYTQKQITVGQCAIKSINIFHGTEDVEIVWESTNYQGKVRLSYLWVNHETLTAIVPEEAEPAEKTGE